MKKVILGFALLILTSGCSFYNINSEEITFTQWKPTVAEAGYLVGEKYVVFLYPKSRLGLTSPVGYAQGKFLVEKKGVNRGVEFIRNKLNNVGLSKNLRTQRIPRTR